MIRHILFDLDCTLYSVRYGLEEKVGSRIQEFIISWFNVSPEESSRLRSEALKNYGTTIEWLINERGFGAVDKYEAYIHPEYEADSLPPDPELRRFIEALPCPCSVLTNAPTFHAKRIINKLGLEGLFQWVFDIQSTGYKGKPQAVAYRKALDTLDLKPEEVLFIDDKPIYVEGYLALGGRGILLDETDLYEDYGGERVKNLQELTRFLTP